MNAEISLPKAFSVRDDHEFQAHQDLMKRLNNNLKVMPVTSGRHLNGGGTVHWGIVCLDTKIPTEAEILVALEEAGYDLTSNGGTLVNWK